MTAAAGNKQAIVLSGGGAYATYEVGVMKALFSGKSPSTDFRPFEPDLFVGASAGALNAATIVAHDRKGLVGAVEYLEEIWRGQIAEGGRACGNGIYRIHGMPFEYLDPRCVVADPLRQIAAAWDDAVFFAREFYGTPMRFALTSGSVLERISRSISLSSFVSTQPLRGALADIIPLEGINQSKRSLHVVAMNLDSGQLTIFTEQDVRRYGHLPILASTALPAFFTPHVIEGNHYIDGSTLANTPLLPAIAAADTLHVIYMDPKLEDIQAERLQNVIDVIDRALVVHFADAFNRDIRWAAEINRGLQLIERPRDQQRLSPDEMHTFLRVASRIYKRIKEGNPYRQLTIHRYHPRDDLGGALGLMNVDSAKVDRVIERGFRDAVEHDCEQSGCVLAEGPETIQPTGQQAKSFRVAAPVEPPIRTSDPAAFRTADITRPQDQGGDDIRMPDLLSNLTLDELAQRLRSAAKRGEATIQPDDERDTDGQLDQGSPPLRNKAVSAKTFNKLPSSSTPETAKTGQQGRVE